ncbi:MAG: ribosome-binding factor A, partial [Cellvibrionales bacterium]
MAQEYSRTQRVGDYLKRELALLMQQKRRDPRGATVKSNELAV